MIRACPLHIAYYICQVWGLSNFSRKSCYRHQCAVAFCVSGPFRSRFFLSSKVIIVIARPSLDVKKKRRNVKKLISLFCLNSVCRSLSLSIIRVVSAGDPLGRPWYPGVISSYFYRRKDDCVCLVLVPSRSPLFLLCKSFTAKVFTPIREGQSQAAKLQDLHELKRTSSETCR